MPPAPFSTLYDLLSYFAILAKMVLSVPAEFDAPARTGDRGLAGVIGQIQRPWSYVRDMPHSEPDHYGYHNRPGDKADVDARDAANEAAPILADGMWHSARELAGIAKKYGASVLGMYQVLDGFGLAQSDSGWYLCIPTDWTPELAPDGT